MKANKLLCILLLAILFMHACVRILTSCRQIPAGEYSTKQARLTGFMVHSNYTDVYFVLRSNCWCDTIVLYNPLDRNKDLTRYVQSERYTITYSNGKPMSFKRNQ
jgi:hypothetical protein